MMHSITLTEHNEASKGFGVASLSQIKEEPHLGDEVLLTLPNEELPVAGSIVRVDPATDQCVIQILEMYHIF